MESDLHEKSAYNGEVLSASGGKMIPWEVVHLFILLD